MTTSSLNNESRMNENHERRKYFPQHLPSFSTHKRSTKKHNSINHQMGGRSKSSSESKSKGTQNVVDRGRSRIQLLTVNNSRLTLT